MRQLSEVRLASAAARRRRSGLAVLALLALLLIGSPPAHALVHRGHVFGGSFGEAFSEGRDRLSGPSALAVDEAASGEAAGDVYVLDSANNRVVRFGPAPAHTFLEAWGYGVSNGSREYQRCASNCRPGLAGFGKGQFDNPVAIAVDNASGSPSHGDVYIVANRSGKKGVIDKFNSRGELITRLIKTKEEKEEAEGMTVGVAVDQNGTVWVERENGEEEFLLERFGSQAPQNRLLGEPVTLEIENLEGPRPARPGFAVDSQGHVYVTYEPEGKDQEEREEEELALKKRRKPQGLCEVHPCLAAQLVLSANFLEAEPLIFEVDGENTTGVAVDLSNGAQSANDVYLDNATSVAAFTSAGSLIQRFGSEQLQDGGGRGLAVDASTDELLVADAAAGTIDAYVPAPPGPPVVKTGSIAAASVTSSSADLRATIDATGADTHYRFQYGSVSCAAAPSSCTEAPRPPAPPNDLGQGFGDQGASVHVAGLSPSTTYHIRVIAENNFGSVESEEHTFTTSSSEAEAALPDGRAWELVSPANKHGASIEPIVGEGGLVQAAADGRSIAYMADAPVGESEPEGNRAPEGAQIISRRAGARWSSLDVATPNGEAMGVLAGVRREYQFFSSDLSAGVVQPHSEVPLSPGVSEPTVYLRKNLTCAATPAECFEPLVTAANDTANSQFGNDVAFSGATPDLRHVILASRVPLTAGASRSGLYEWSAGQLQLVSVLPNGTPATEGVSLGSGGATEMARTAISHDGSRVIWRTNGGAAGHLYMRDVATGETLQVDEANGGAPPSKIEPRPEFQTASADGSRVFFTDARRLTADSTAREEPQGKPPPDLYVFEPERPAGERLTDLTVPTNSGESADAQGGVLGISEDGSLVYFVANGVLAEGAQPGNCRTEAPTGAGCNLYVEHRNGEGWEAPRLIGRLSGEDAADWGEPASQNLFDLKTMTSRVSSSGEYLSFMSNRPLTGYNNTDANSGAADEEVFLYRYQAGTSSLVCASCNPSGAQPVGVHDIEESGEGFGLLVDRPETWLEGFKGVDHWLAGSVPGWTSVSLRESLYQSRYLSDSGRLFFNSPDNLLPLAATAKEKVYEYEPKGEGGCQVENTQGGCVALISSGTSDHESAFVDASESGNDVFFLTNAKLSSSDVDTSFDIYDARVCDAPGAEACVSSGSAPPPACSGEACKPPASSQPVYGPPSSSTFSGSGNIVQQAVLGSKSAQKAKAPTRAQKLAAALKKCRKLKQKKKRQACIRQARKKYGAKTSRARRSSARRGPAGGSSVKTRP
jgi:hypothetical protein